MKTLRNSEYLFTRKVKGTDDIVSVIVYIMYNNGTYSIQMHGEESVFFGKRSNLARDLVLADLCKEAMTFINSELKGGNYDQ